MIALANPRHPREILSVEFIDKMKLTSKSVADSVFLAEDDIESIIAGTIDFTADLALRLSAFFGTTPDFWTALQQSYDLSLVRGNDRLQAKLGRIVPTMAIDIQRSTPY
ncbi:HigA family addiction module antitoxin [uncultured Roseobacter sp.]|uniref:HigA family addiction module antitoxin n=1 Tax=uncultured Roseobacter sp. TaxID=114847 RepID=UPI0026086FE3|nr:HigA family addiction module antitoxin [uncultured Roseobacter sp.]